MRLLFIRTILRFNFHSINILFIFISDPIFEFTHGSSLGENL